MDFMEVINRRRSIRKYKPDAIPEEDIKDIIEAARLAPSWANSQCWKFVVITDPDVKSQLAKAGNSWIENAPVIITICADPTKPGTKGDQEYYMLDAGIAMEHLILAAANKGLGTCWIGAFDEKAAAKALGVPDNIRVVASTPLGYPAEEPSQRPRRKLEDVMCINRYE
ncbi:nitroreductase [Candidatus Poribacteria bacterium]|nr:nitroreductase [Candidatus Poribacteria bacterium]